MSQDPADKCLFLTRNREAMRGQVGFQFRRRHLLQLQMTTSEFRKQPNNIVEHANDYWQLQKKTSALNSLPYFT